MDSNNGTLRPKRSETEDDSYVEIWEYYDIDRGKMSVFCNGGDKFLGYCPLGEGKVELAKILDLMEGRKLEGRVMVELDSPPPQPIPAIDTAKTAKAWLQKQGVKFAKA